MNYQQTINYLFSQMPVFQQVGAGAYKEGLDNSLALDKYFAHPHTRYKTIHVAGTNGKGSTSHLLAAILQEAGYKVGLYTSPHLVDFRERIRVNGKKIPEQYVVDFVERHRSFFEPIHPSFFELTMMMSFCYFAEQEVDVAVIEVGLGGRLDSTNIITPIASVITNISLDHTQFLGDTPEAIATEKAGIIKPGIPVVIGEAQGGVRKVFEAKAQEAGAPIIFAEEANPILAADRQANGRWQYQTEPYPNLVGELGGLAQVKNAATVLCVLDVLQNEGLNIVPKAVYEGFANVCELTGLMGRWQIIRQSAPKIVCDTGHNTGGIRYIAEQLASEKYNRLHIVIGMVNDKDISHVLELLPKKATYYFTRADIPRALSDEDLRNQASAFGLEGRSYHYVRDAVEAALENATDDDFIFIGGSNFVIAEALPLFD
ncbi:dihydrofolate synthase/folylpolyglutamate synthase [Dysgonomonas sp. PH5-45]|uniref:bifunctional folylpolyglutamate synthase/dihydrofolate synthase n=1 Tax=unclassified Dysgonomonas TaxID=2630389 RepID=UPI0024762897|nr:MULTISPECIES: folylpolyglutamate synthase/dihydrofolate synthase family protein [unclassified Dysgonomonas]MDH6355025.1 dihydrofolate synthase/folylpolyglutamate synthase [Dysgonomonas sp. PH5-45]MDH6387925.1 dihydrofolate synthase/folylpolyglutamate synthase [Dysgonomonas sp. PH5-37]